MSSRVYNTAGRNRVFVPGRAGSIYPPGVQPPRARKPRARKPSTGRVAQPRKPRARKSSASPKRRSSVNRMPPRRLSSGRLAPPPGQKRPQRAPVGHRHFQTREIDQAFCDIVKRAAALAGADGDYHSAFLAERYRKQYGQYPNRGAGARQGNPGGRGKRVYPGEEHLTTMTGRGSRGPRGPPKSAEEARARQEAGARITAYNAVVSSLMEQTGDSRDNVRLRLKTAAPGRQWRDLARAMGYNV